MTRSGSPFWLVASRGNLRSLRASVGRGVINARIEDVHESSLPIGLSWEEIVVLCRVEPGRGEVLDLAVGGEEEGGGPAQIRLRGSARLSAGGEFNAQPLRAR